jgi:Xaa-Pro aminopeptidase
LADLFELELNKLKNQYETVQRGEQQARDQQMDEALQRLKELAQRQQQEIERNRMLGQRASSGSSGGGRSTQQQLIDEAERLQRQLQRLSRERSSPELNQVSSQLQRAIDEMKRAAERGERGNSQEAAAQGMRALQQLEDARRALQRNQDAGLSSGIEQAADESKRLLEEQKKIQEGIEKLAQEKGQGNSADRKQRRTDLVERKSVLADRLKSLGSELDNLSRQARRTQREASTKLADASGTIRDKRLSERILQGNQYLENEYYDFLKGREEFIRGNMEELARQLESARNNLGQTREGKLEETVNKTRQLAEGLESMERRLRNARQGSRGNRSQQQQQQSGREGQQSPSGAQQSSEGAQGQRGEQGGSEGRGSRNQQGSERAGTQGGQPGGDVRGLTGNAYGPPIGVGPHSDEELRRLRRETQERLGDAQELRRLMDRNSTQMQNLAQVIEALRRLDSARNYSDPEEIARLKQAIDLLRQVELDLSRELDRLTQKDKYFFSEDNEAPANYRKLVEEYYKALAKGKP